MMAFLSLMGLLVGHCKPQYCVLWAATQPSGHHVWHGRQRMNARESSALFLFTVVRVCIGGNSFSCVCLVVRIFRLSIRSLWLLNCNSLLSLHRNGNAERRMKMRSVCAALILRWVCVCVRLETIDNSIRNCRLYSTYHRVYQVWHFKCLSENMASAPLRSTKIVICLLLVFFFCFVDRIPTLSSIPPSFSVAS